MVSMYFLLTMIIKKYTSILRVYLRIYSKNQQFSVCVSCIKNFNLSSVNFPGSTVIKYACISYYKCIPYLEIKYSKGNLLVNNFPLIFPDKILLFLHQVKTIRSIVEHKFNSEFLVTLDDQVLGIFGTQEIKMLKPTFSPFWGLQFKRWFNLNNIISTDPPPKFRDEPLDFEPSLIRQSNRSFSPLNKVLPIKNKIPIDDSSSSD